MASAAQGSPEALNPKAKNAIRGAFLGFYVDMFDIYLPILVLAPALIYFVPEGVSPTVAALASGSIFAATLVTRPIGALIFGRYADTIGRKKTTIIAVSGFGAMSVVMAALPGYQQWGVAAIIVFILAR